MKRATSLLILLFAASAAFSQAYTATGDTIYGDTLRTRYARIYTYDVTDTFTVPKGAMKVTLHNHGADTAYVRTNDRDTPATLPNGTEEMEFCAWQIIGSGRWAYARVPAIWIDAAGTRVTVIEVR